MTAPVQAPRPLLEAQDFYASDALFLSDQDRLVRDSARDFTRREILPNIRRWDRGDIAPYKNQEEMVRATAKKIGETLGLFGLNLPGLGAYTGEPDLETISHGAYGAALRELEYGDSTLRSLVSVQSSLVMFAVHSYGSQDQKKRWLGPLHSGQALGCFGLTEPQGGSDPGNMTTTAQKFGQHWALNGTKVWITNGFADVAVVWAKTPEGVRGFLVEKGTPGFANRSEEKWTFRAGVASTLSFENCRVGAEALLPGTLQPAGRDLACPLSCLTEARYGICWGAVGAARACLDEVLRVTAGRKLFGEALAAKQEIQRKLTWCLNEIENAQLAAHQLARLKGTSRFHHAQVSLAKYNNVSKACEVARMAVEMLPADVFTFDAYDSGRHFRNLEVVKKYEGTHEVHTFIVGRALTGHSAF